MYFTISSLGQCLVRISRIAIATRPEFVVLTATRLAKAWLKLGDLFDPNPSGHPRVLSFLARVIYFWRERLTFRGIFVSAAVAVCWMTAYASWPPVETPNHEAERIARLGVTEGTYIERRRNIRMAIPS
jgi:hypothetical protein